LFQPGHDLWNQMFGQRGWINHRIFKLVVDNSLWSNPILGEQRQPFIYIPAPSFPAHLLIPSSLPLSFPPFSSSLKKWVSHYPNFLSEWFQVTLFLPAQSRYIYTRKWRIPI
jgi:hypothetical protein